MVNSLSLGVELDDLLHVFSSLVLELLAISTVPEFVCLVVVSSACDFLCKLLLACAFTGGRFIVINGDVVRNDRVVFGDDISFRVNVGIKLVGLRSECVMGREAAFLSCMVISDAANEAMLLPRLGSML